jgi:GNAT superfamily N-acetyltransferase
MTIQTAKTAKDVAFCREVISGLRPDLDMDNFVPQIMEMMQEGYHLLYIADDDNQKAACFIGYRTLQMLRTGTIIYIDDLFTLSEYRGRGFARSLLNYVHRQAADSGIKSVHLDSGYTRHDAHRLYLNKGYVIECLHFAHTLPS